MKKSVKKILGIYSLVMFCSVLMSNTLFVSSSQAQALIEKKAPTATISTFTNYGSYGFQPQQQAPAAAAATPAATDKKKKAAASSPAESSYVLSEKAYNATRSSIPMPVAVKTTVNPVTFQKEYTVSMVKGSQTKTLEAALTKAGEKYSVDGKEFFNTPPNTAVSAQTPAESAESGAGAGAGAGSGSKSSGKINGVGTYTPPVGGAYCKSTTTVFETIACKVITTLDDLRMVIYVLAGFGLIAFAFSAIFGKVSWKHLGQLGFGLFLISMMAPFITYFTHPSDDGYKIKYGDYLPEGDFTAEFAKVGVVSTDQTKCAEDELGAKCLSEVLIEGKAPTGTWSLKDLKGTVQSAIKTAQAAHSTLQATKAAVKEVKAQATLVSGALKHSGGGVSGLLNIAGTVSNAGAALGQTGYTLGKNVQYNAATAANSYQDAFLTNEQRTYNEKERAAGKQTNSLATMVSDTRSGYVKKGDNFYDEKGNKVLIKANEQGQFYDVATGKVLGDKVDEKGNLVVASQFTNIVSNAEKAREYGMKGGAALTSASNDSQNMNNMVGGVGGGFLGNVAGLVTLGASATGNLVDMDSQVKQNTQAKKEAQASQAASISGVKSNVTDKQGNNTIKYNDGTEEYKTKEGSHIVTRPDGSSTEKTAAGAIIERGKDGSAVTKNPDGSIYQAAADGSGAKVDKKGNLVAEYQDGFYTAIYDKGGNKTELIRSGDGYVDLDKDGKVKNVYDNKGKIVQKGTAAATPSASTSDTSAPIVDKRTAEQKAIMGE